MVVAVSSESSMMRPQLATIGQRFAAAAINLVIGMLPLAVPNFIRVYGQSNTGWVRTESFLDVLAIGLGLLQLVFVYKMQGSPGAVFAGLRVQNLDGTPPGIKTTLVRATPYLVAVASIVLMPREGGNQVFVAFFAMVLVGAVTFICLSGIIAALTRERSLTDRITGTDIVKIYSIMGAD